MANSNDSKKNNTNNHSDSNSSSKYPMLDQYSKDLATYRDNTTIPENSEINPPPPVVDNYPVCKDCNTPFYHDYDDNKFHCPCPHSIRAAEIEFSPFNKHGKYSMSLSDRSKLSYEEQLKRANGDNYSTTNNKRTNSNSSSNIETITGADTDSGGNNSSDTGGRSFFQSFDPRMKVIQERKGYSNASRNSGRDAPVNIHPLDRELTEKGYKLVNSYELPRQFETSRDIVEKNPRDRVRTYSRYSDDGNPDPYDGN